MKFKRARNIQRRFFLVKRARTFFDIDIAKAFLEAFFQRKIKNLKIKPEEKRISDFFKIVRFDYHCVFDDDTNVVIEMQQWYKLDIVKRFYLYHAVQASLQLEDLAQKLIFPQGSVQEDIKIPKESKTQDYSAVIPTITLIWLVEESFGFEGIPYISYVLQNENIDRFLFDPLLKDMSKKEILDKIEEFKNISKNTNKDLDFLKKKQIMFLLSG